MSKQTFGIERSTARREVRGIDVKLTPSSMVNYDDENSVFSPNNTVSSTSGELSGKDHNADKNDVMQTHACNYVANVSFFL